MNSTLLTLAALLALPFIAGGPPCHAAPPQPDGDALLDRSLAVFDHAKTLQATVTVKANRDGAAGSTVIRASVENAPDGSIARCRLVTTSTHGNVVDPALLGEGQSVMLEDSQWSYQIDPARKTYRKFKSGRDHYSSLFRGVVAACRKHHLRLTATPSSWQGEPATLLQGAADGVTMRAVVSRGDLHLEKLSATTASGITVADMTLTDLRLDAPLPPTLFQKPGADYKQLPIQDRP